MVMIKKWSVIKDIKGEEYRLNFNAKATPIHYLNGRLIFSLDILKDNCLKENNFAANYSDIEFVETMEEKKAVING